MLHPKWGLRGLILALLAFGAGCGATPSSGVAASGSDGLADATASEASDESEGGAGSGQTAPPESDGPVFDPLPGSQTDACTPATACPQGVQCGHYVDPCTNTVMTCGAACPSGSVCTVNSANPSSQSCQPKACAGKCGVVGLDGCGPARAGRRLPQRDVEAAPPRGAARSGDRHGHVPRGADVSRVQGAGNAARGRARRHHRARTARRLDFRRGQGGGECI